MTDERSPLTGTSPVRNPLRALPDPGSDNQTNNGTLPWSQRICYGVGHVLNDLTASLWFSYLIVYMQFVLGFDTGLAGWVLMVGQFADALATPLIGYEADNASDTPACRKYGRRKALHLIGTIAVVLSFPFIFAGCPGCPGRPSHAAMLVLLVPLVSIFQFGWAATQVAHLALIPDLTENQSERDLLNIIRYAFDVIADVMVYVVAWIVFDLTTTYQNGDENQIGPEDNGKFLLIVVIVTVGGAIFSIIFQVGVKERNHSITTHSVCSGSSGSSQSQVKVVQMKWNDWLTEPAFYQVALLYSFTRLFQNFCTVFIPLYLQESLGAHQNLLAKIPLVMNLSGFAASLTLRFCLQTVGKKASYLGGVVIGLGGCAWIAFDHGYPFCAKGIYGVAVLLGASASAMVICSLTFVPDLIGNNNESGAFVYGTMSFFDKMANGVGVLLVQHLHGAICPLDDECHWFYQNVLGYGTGGIALFSALVLTTISTGNLDKRRKAKRALERLDETAEDSSEFRKLTRAKSKEKDWKTLGGCQKTQPRLGKRAL